MSDLATGKTPETSAEPAREIRLQAQKLGFDACGIASAAEPIDPKNRFRSWIERGYAADMHWMVRTEEQRRDVRLKLPGARSVIVLARNYHFPRPDAAEHETGKVAAYAWGRDYHKVLKKPLITLAKHIESLGDDVMTYSSVDTGPVLERAWAQRAGVGSIGKNTMALRRDMGSWFFLATILTTLELKPDAPAQDLCGTCTRCLDACPTQAFEQPYVLNANRCISYQTIENRGEIPNDIQSRHGDWVFGCDICQEVCPWNRFATVSSETDFQPRDAHANPPLDNLLAMDQETFNREFAGTPIRRAKHEGMLRNAHIAKGNAPS